jgi:hypothetical protein
MAGMANDSNFVNVEEQQKQAAADNQQLEHIINNSHSRYNTATPNPNLAAIREEPVDLLESFIPNDTDSVSTFGGGQSRAASRRSGRSLQSNHDDNTVVSGISQVSMTDLSALETRVAGQLHEQSSHLAELKAMMTMFMGASQAQQQEKAHPPPAEKESLPNEYTSDGEALYE